LDEKPAVWNDDLPRLREMVEKMNKHSRYKHMDHPTHDIQSYDRDIDRDKTLASISDGH